MNLDRLPTSALLDPRRDHYGRDTDTQPIETELERIGTHDPIRAGDSVHWGWNMIEEPTMFVVCDNEQSFIPLRTRPQRLVNFLHEHLLDNVR